MQIPPLELTSKKGLRQQGVRTVNFTTSMRFPPNTLSHTPETPAPSPPAPSRVDTQTVSLLLSPFAHTIPFPSFRSFTCVFRFPPSQRFPFYSPRRPCSNFTRATRAHPPEARIPAVRVSSSVDNPVRGTCDQGLRESGSAPAAFIIRLLFCYCPPEQIRTKPASTTPERKPLRTRSDLPFSQIADRNVIAAASRTINEEQ